MTFEIGIAWFNGIVLLLIAVIPIVTLFVTRRPEWGDVRAHKYSLKARLPFGSEVVAQSIRRHLRFVIRTRMWVFIALLIAIAAVYIVVPVRSSPIFLWAFSFSLLAVGMPAASVFSSLRERLFAPAPTAPRIARTRGLVAADYLGPLRRLTPNVLFIAATIAVGALFAVSLLTGYRFDTATVIVCGGMLLVALIAAVADRLLERLVLARPQPASNTVELAWDDSFRSDTLGWLRLGAATTAVIPLGLAGAALLVAVLTPAEPEFITALELFPWWAAIALQLSYQFGEGHMPRALYPAQLGPRPRLTVAEAFA